MTTLPDKAKKISSIDGGYFEGDFAVITDGLGSPIALIGPTKGAAKHTQKPPYVESGEIEVRVFPVDTIRYWVPE